MSEKIKGQVEYNQYWLLEHDVSRGFNILKGKLFNLAESVITEQKQLEAFKGLIKDFANDSYRLVVEDLRHDAVELGLLSKEEMDSAGSITPSYPLETE